MVLTVTLNPSVDRALFLDELKVGDTNRVLRSETDAGGKGINLSRVLTELGGKTLTTGFLGGGIGAFVRKVLEDQAVPHLFLEVPGETRTNVSIEDKKTGCPTTLNERGPEISPADMERLLGVITDELARVQWIAIGGSLPPGVPQDVFQKIISMAQAKNVRTLVDADGEPMRLAMRARPNFIKPNEREAARLIGREINGRNEALEAAVELYQQLGAQDAIVVISRGAGGAVMVCDQGQFDGISPPIETKSTIGCGDSMLAGMLWAMQGGETVPDSFRWGLAAGAATAATDGTAIGSGSRIRQLHPQTKIVRI